MGCRCAERGQALRSAAAAAIRGDAAAVRAKAAFVGRSLVQDARSGDLAREAARRLAALKTLRRR